MMNTSDLISDLHPQCNTLILQCTLGSVTWRKLEQLGPNFCSPVHVAPEQGRIPDVTKIQPIKLLSTQPWVGCI